MRAGGRACTHGRTGKGGVAPLRARTDERARITHVTTSYTQRTRMHPHHLLTHRRDASGVLSAHLPLPAGRAGDVVVWARQQQAQAQNTRVCPPPQ